MKISVFGLGYVGAVTLACLGRDGHDVIGVDIDERKLALIREGKSPIVERDILELIATVVETGRVDVTSYAEDAISRSEISFICVGTPSLPNGDQDLSAITRLSEQIGQALQKKEGHHTVVIRSTVQPGTVEGLILPLIEEHSGRKDGANLSICFQPEFLREGTSIRDYDNPPMTVVGSENRRAIDHVEELFGHLPGKFISTDIKTAETLKYACNAFHAMKVTFANEIGRIGQALGSNPHEVMRLLCEDKQLNISPAYLKPGFAFGGSCLPKDLRALLYMAKEGDLDVPLLSSLLPSNRVHLDHALNIILARDVRRIAVIGLSFKSGTDDLRESPMVTLVEQMIGKGLQLRIFDPEVQVSRLLGANRKYIEDVIPHIGELLVESVEDAIEGADAIVVGLQGPEIAAKLLQLNSSGQLVVDLVGLNLERELKGDYKGLCW